VGTVIIAAFAKPLSDLALALGPIEKFSLMSVGLVAAVALAHGRWSRHSAWC
jgi:TctA family transporter